MATTRTDRSRRARARPAPPPPEGVETLLHATSVKAGATAALREVLHALPILRPFLPDAIADAVAPGTNAARRRALVREIYRRYGQAPAEWEIEAVLAVATAQSAATPLATRGGLRRLVEGWLPAPVAAPLLRWVPIEPLVARTAQAVASTWATGRYADAVCRLRRQGADWLPAPLAEALQLAPAMLKDMSGEAIGLALSPLKIALGVGRRINAAIDALAEPPAPRTARAAKAAASTKAAKAPRATQATPAKPIKSAKKKAPATKAGAPSSARAPQRRPVAKVASQPRSTQIPRRA
jgi:hypothetical protein